MTPYDLLGLPPDADDETIAMAFREAAKRWHPDLNPNDPEAERQFKQIAAARDALLNPAWRALYRYLQVRRQHDRRLWIGTIVSCVVSALVGGGLVSFLQKPPMPDPPLLAATLSSELNRDQHDHVVCTSDVACKEDQPAISNEASGLRKTEHEEPYSCQTADQDRLQFATFGTAQPVPEQRLTALEQVVRNKEAAPHASN